MASFRTPHAAMRLLSNAMPLPFARKTAASCKVKICIDKIQITPSTAIHLIHNVGRVCSRTFTAPNALQFFTCPTCFSPPACMCYREVVEAGERGRLKIAGNGPLVRSEVGHHFHTDIRGPIRGAELESAEAQVPERLSLREKKRRSHKHRGE